MLKFASIICTILAFGVTIAQNIIGEKELDKKVEEKVSAYIEEHK